MAKRSKQKTRGSSSKSRASASNNKGKPSRAEPKPASDKAPAVERASTAADAPASRARPGRVAWALGVVALASLVTVALSGLWLLVGYDGARAHDAMKDLQAVGLLGATMRSVHLLAANLLLLSLGAHLVALLLSRRAPRPLQGLLTVGMLLVAVAMSCSGEALPWDRQAQQATHAATGLGAEAPIWGAIQQVLRAGPDTTDATRKRLHYLHVLPLPLPLLGLGLLLGRWRISRRKPGDGEAGDGEASEQAPAFAERPALAVALATATALVVAAALWQPALGPPADATVRITPAKAPWFLAGWQEAATYAPWVGLLLFGGLLLALLLAPWIARGTGRGANGPTGLAALLDGPLTAVVVGGVAAGAVYWWQDPSYGAPSALNPATIALLATAALAALAWRVFGGDRGAAFRALLAGLVATVVVLTAVGWLGRGPSWQLGWHPGQGVVGEAIVPQAVEATAPEPAMAEGAKDVKAAGGGR